MGTLSNRPLSDFGDGIKERIDEFRSNVGSRIDDIREKVRVAQPMRAIDRVPPSTWFALAGASVLGSFVLKLFGKNHASLFVAQWAPTFLILGLYKNRLNAF